MADLIGQIKREAQELKDAPVITPVLGKVARCHLCGCIVDAYSLARFDAHIPRGANIERWACQNCHPDRSK